MNPITYVKKIVKMTLLASLLPSFATAAVSTTLTEITAPTKKKSNFFSKEKWGANYLNYVNGPTFSEANGASINHYLTLKRRFGPNWALSGVFRPDSNLANGNPTMEMGDSYVRLDYPTIYKGKNGIKISGHLRYYAPMSKASKEAKLAGKITPRIYATKSFGKLNLMYILIPTIYMNTVPEDGQKILSQSHWVSGSYRLSKLLSFDFAIYPGWSYSRNTPVSFNNIPTYPGVTLVFNDQFSVSPYLELTMLELEAKSSSAGMVMSYNFF